MDLKSLSEVDQDVDRAKDCLREEDWKKALFYLGSVVLGAAQVFVKYEIKREFEGKGGQDGDAVR